jgi:hypothetical protein
MTVAFRVNKYYSGASLFVVDLIPWYKTRADFLRSDRKLRACCPADHLRRIHSSAGTGAPIRDQRTSVQINDATHGQDRCQGRGGAGAALFALFQPEREEAQRHSLKLWLMAPRHAGRLRTSSSPRTLPSPSRHRPSLSAMPRPRSSLLRCPLLQLPLRQ